MTTGRINQVTTGGRGSARPTHKMRLPAARHPPHRLGCPRLPNRTRVSLAKPPTPYANGGTTTGCPAPGRRPRRCCPLSTESDRTYTHAHTNRFTREMVQPHNAIAGTGLDDARGRPSQVQRHTHRSAQQARQCLCRVDQPHMAPQQ